MTEIVIVVSPIDFEHEGYHPPPDAPVSYRVRIGSDDAPEWEEGLRCPLYDGARKLLGQGVAPETPLALRHRGSKTISMRTTVGEAAKWTLEESRKKGPNLVRYREFPSGTLRGSSLEADSGAGMGNDP